MRILAKVLVTLVNLYILIIRTSFEKKHEHILETLFKNEVEPEVIKNIFELFLVSLNNNYYSHLPNHKNNFDTLNSWLELFREVGYLQEISNIPLSIIFLTEDTYNEKNNIFKN